MTPNKARLFKVNFGEDNLFSFNIFTFDSFTIPMREVVLLHVRHIVYILCFGLTFCTEGVFCLHRLVLLMDLLQLRSFYIFVFGANVGKEIKRWGGG